MSPPHPLRLWVLVLVGVGGSLGASARYGLGQLLTEDTSGFPWTTFGINVAGSLMLAALPALAAVRRSHSLPPLLGTGVLGGFTTLSAYSEETRALVAEGAVGTAAAYVVGTLTACLVAVTAADRLSSQQARREFDDEEGDL